MNEGFDEFGVPGPLCKGLAELGIVRPTEVREKVISYLMEKGGDFIVRAQTGTGKTAASDADCGEDAGEDSRAGAARGAVVGRGEACGAR